MGRMKKEKFDFGHVLDGDADRIAAVMPGGEFVSPQKILGLLILHLVRNRQGGRRHCQDPLRDDHAGPYCQKTWPQTL